MEILIIDIWLEKLRRGWKIEDVPNEIKEAIQNYRSVGEGKMTYMDKLMEKKTFREKFNKEYEELCGALDNGTPVEKNNAELEILGRLLYYEGD